MGITKLDIDAMDRFITESDNILSEFNSIKAEFETINTQLNANWNGEGGEAYEIYAANITEKLGDLGANLQAIKDSITSIKDAYNSADEQLGEMNRTAGDE